MNRLILIPRMLFDVQISEAGKKAETKKYNVENTIVF